MGMDVYGRNPSAPAGRYFRASVWSWRPIHALVARLCPDLLDAGTLDRMGSNSGAGPADRRTCVEMASRFERWMEHHAGGHGVESDLRVTRDGRLVSAEEAADPDLETVSAYEVADEHLKEWVEFLRHCGGFEVW